MKLSSAKRSVDTKGLGGEQEYCSGEWSEEQLTERSELIYLTGNTNKHPPFYTYSTNWSESGEWRWGTVYC